MAAQPKPYITPEQYLEMERACDECPSEYYKGQMFPMEATTGRHCTLVMHLSRILYPQVRKAGRRLYETTAKLRTGEDGPYFYPDLFAICGPKSLVDNQLLDVWSDAVLVIEVLSASTTKYDHTFKLDQYQKLPSLMEYLMVSQDRVYVELVSRTSPDDKWRVTQMSDLEDVVRFPIVNSLIKLADLYDDTGLEGAL